MDHQNAPSKIGEFPVLKGGAPEAIHKPRTWRRFLLRSGSPLGHPGADGLASQAAAETPDGCDSP